MSAAAEQLALSLDRRTCGPGPFLAAPSNAAARRWLDHVGEWHERRLAIWGTSGCGKSHLARLWAGEGAFWQGALSNLAAMTADRSVYERLAIDDADACSDAPGLLHVLNACAEARIPVLLTGSSPPARWPVDLPDLASRLRAMQSVGIDPPEDALLRAVLTRALAERQMVMAPAVGDWLLLRLPRTAACVIDAVERLDHASLAQHNAVTIPLAASVLRDLLDLGPEFTDFDATLPAPPA